MSNVVQAQFGRPKASPAAEQNAPEEAVTPIGDDLQAMLQQSAAMEVVATLQFYASQHFDHGKRARKAIASMHFLLTGQAQVATPPQQA